MANPLLSAFGLDGFELGGIVQFLTNQLRLCEFGLGQMRIGWGI